MCIRDRWGPGEEHSPNTLFAAAMNQGGFALQIPRPELYYELLPAHYVKVHVQRGVKIGGLWYGRSDPALKPYEGKLSDRAGSTRARGWSAATGATGGPSSSRIRPT